MLTATINSQIDFFIIVELVICIRINSSGADGVKDAVRILVEGNPGDPPGFQTGFVQNVVKIPHVSKFMAFFLEQSDYRQF